MRLKVGIKSKEWRIMNRGQNEISPVRVRFAPSPTGHLHIGGLRTALFNWLFARHYNGLFLIRLEDTDRERSKQEYVDSIVGALEWVKITADEPIIKQSDRFPEYSRLAQQLLNKGKAYRCFCLQEEIEARQKEKGLDPLFVGYDGFCRDRQVTAADLEKPHVIRFKIPYDIDEVTFDDLIRGSISFAREQLDDFIIVRSDGTPTYNFAVVIDDAAMRISHVIRGEDHISNTPKQILLYHAFDYSIPEFAHVPLILGPSGQRLSKRDAPTGVLEYRHNGYLPDALVNYLVRLGWSHGDQEIFTRQELINYFTLDHVGKKGAIFDQEKLDWINGVYMRNTDNQILLDIILASIKSDFLEQLKKWNKEQIFILLDLYKQRAKTLRELVDELLRFYKKPHQYDQDAIKKWIRPESIKYLQFLIERLERQDDFSVDGFSSVIHAVCNELSIKLVKLAQPIRIALTGSSASPGIFELLSVLGKEEGIARLKAFVDFLEKSAVN
jgi:glutamyl-tRNA synthetase